MGGSDLLKGYCTNTGGNPTLLHLALKMHDETTHKHVVRPLGQKLRRGLLDGYVKLSNRAMGEKS